MVCDLHTIKCIPLVFATHPTMQVEPCFFSRCSSSDEGSLTWNIDGISVMMDAAWPAECSDIFYFCFGFLAFAVF